MTIKLRKTYRKLSIEEFEVLNLLGSGGFGTCRKAFYHGTVVCVKQIHRTSKHEAARQSFKAETKEEFFCFNHDNVVKLLASTEFSSDDVIYDMIMVFEYVPGRNLQSLLDDEEFPISLADMCIYGNDIVKGLAYVHNYGIAHLDLKPANIMVTLAGVCKLADFGCSQYIKDAIVPKSLLTGTCAYRAPELYRGEIPTASCDIYALGICLWQFWSREFPFAGIDQQSVIFRVVKFNLRPSFEGGMHLHPLYENLARKCWSADAEKRPNIKNILDSLENIIETAGQSTQAPYVI